MDLSTPSAYLPNADDSASPTLQVVEHGADQYSDFSPPSLDWTTYLHISSERYTAMGHPLLTNEVDVPRLLHGCR